MKKFRLTASIVASFLLMCIFAIAVYALKSVSLNTTGTIQFTVHYVDVWVSGGVTNAYQSDGATPLSVASYSLKRLHDSETSARAWEINGSQSNTMYFGDVHATTLSELEEIVITLTVYNNSNFAVKAVPTMTFTSNADKVTANITNMPILPAYTGETIEDSADVAESEMPHGDIVISMKANSIETNFDAGFVLDISLQRTSETSTVATLSDIERELTQFRKVTLTSDVTDVNGSLVVDLDNDMYIDLNNHTLTLVEFNLNADSNSTITIKNGTIVTTDGITISAPNGDVILTDVTGYDAQGIVNLAAGSNSLHVNGTVEFREGTESESTLAEVAVLDGTHFVVEQDAEIVVMKLVVNNEDVAVDNRVGITLDVKNDDASVIVVEGDFTAENNTNSSVVSTTSSYGNLWEAINNGCDSEHPVVLTDDIDLRRQLVVKTGVTIDLNGHTIYNSNDLWDYPDTSSWSLISVQSGTLTIIDSSGTNAGTLRAKLNDCYAIDVRDNGHLEIRGGTFIGNVHSVYVHDGSLVVNGGYFSVQQKYSATKPDEFVLNCLDANYRNGTATISVTAGDFEGFNPSDCAAEGEHTNFVLDGLSVDYRVEDGKTIWYVFAIK